MTRLSIVLLAAVMFSALYLVRVQYDSRRLFTELDRATAEAAGVPFYVVPWGGGPGVEVPTGHRLTRLGDLLQQGRIAAAG